MTDTIQKFDTTLNAMQSLLWQYNTAVNIQGLLQFKQDWYVANQTQFWDDWYRDVFNLATANEFGLFVWSIILGQPIVFPNVADPNKINWGFGTYHKNFERGNFASTSGFTYTLSKETARIILQLRYFQLTTAGAIPEVNRMLAYVFKGYGPAHLLDGHDMKQKYIFGFILPADMKFVFDNYDILPRPAGVGSDYDVIIEESFGFDEFHENFDNGNFSEG